MHGNRPLCSFGNDDEYGNNTLCNREMRGNFAESAYAQSVPQAAPEGQRLSLDPDSAKFPLISRLQRVSPRLLRN